MISFDAIDARLEILGKSRAWLAEVTGRSPDAIRGALAPNAPPHKRSDKLQRLLSEAIEKEEALRREVILLPERITLEVTQGEFDAFSEAALAQHQTLKRWAIEELNKAAEAYQKLTRYETHEEWQARQEPLRVAEEPEEGKLSRSGPA